VVEKRPLAPLALLLVGITGLVLLSRQSEPDVLSYVLLLAATAATTTAYLWRAKISSARLVFAGALLAHAITLAGTPAFEDDHFRFLWDGWRTLQDGTPYGVAPENYFGDGSVPSALRGVLDGVNYPEYPTIYGPFLQIVFAGIFALFGASPIGLQLLFAAANLLLIALLLRRHEPGKVALYAWNPLVIAETSLHLHPDGLLAAALFAALLAGRARPVLAGLLLGMAAGVKLVALAALPILLRMRPSALVAAIASLGILYLPFLVQGQGAGFDSTATFATLWHFNPLMFEPLFLLFGWQSGRIAALLIAGVLVLWLHARSYSVDDVPLAAIFGVILLFAPAVNSWYLLWLLPFAVGRKQIWPFAATVALPFSYLTGLNLNDPALDAFAVHPMARAAEWAILLLALFYDWQTHRRINALAECLPLSPLANPKIAVIMPALNEEASIGGVVTGIRKALPKNLKQVIVVDNGCMDRTASVAQAAGAMVVVEAQRGYGAACLTGIAWLEDDVDIVLFVDSDGSDVLEDAPKIVEPILAGQAALVIGSRSLGQIQRGAMTAPQRFGNWLAPLLVRLIWGVRYTDLGPFRAIRRSSLEALAMQDRDFGWTIEMQVRAAKLGLRIVEIPTGYRRRIGVSKISGTIDGVLKAGVKILYVIGREAFGDFDAVQRRPQPSFRKMRGTETFCPAEPNCR
jgi:hypothetical protein